MYASILIKALSLKMKYRIAQLEKHCTQQRAEKTRVSYARTSRYIYYVVDINVLAEIYKVYKNQFFKCKGCIANTYALEIPLV